MAFPSDDLSAAAPVPQGTPPAEQGTEDTDYPAARLTREGVQRSYRDALARAMHDRYCGRDDWDKHHDPSEPSWPEMADAAARVPHPDTAEAARLRAELTEARQQAQDIVAERDAAREELADSSRERNVYAERWRQNGKALLQRRSELDLALWLHAEAAWQRDVLSWLHAEATQRLYYALPELSYWRDIVAPALSDMLRGMARRSVRLKRQRYHWRRTLKAIHAATGAEKGVPAVVAVEQLRSRVADLEGQLAAEQESRFRWAEEAAASIRLPDDWRDLLRGPLAEAADWVIDRIESWRGGTAEEGQRDG